MMTDKLSLIKKIYDLYLGGFISSHKALERISYILDGKTPEGKTITEIIPTSGTIYANGKPLGELKGIKLKYIKD
jgi:hypothetical protein